MGNDSIDLNYNKKKRTHRENENTSLNHAMISNLQKKNIYIIKFK